MLLAASGCSYLNMHRFPEPRRDYVIAVHGGAGEMGGQAEDPEISAMYYAALDTALTIGGDILDKGGSATDAVLAVIRYFESNPLFNAGVGATVSAEGYFELDAAIMDGKDLDAGAVAGVRHVRHPIDAAYAVMTGSPHVMLSGDGADRFAAEKGLETVDDNTYFATPKTMEWVKKFQEESKKNGTVGCVVLDRDGNLAAGTSTGGMFGKRWGRIGDSPVIGAGTYADNGSVAVSCTGHGEYFIRHSAAVNVSMRYKFLGETLEEASEHVIFEELNREEGNGGLIAVDRYGNIAMPFNCSGMYRGYLYKEKESGKTFKAYGISEKMIEKQ